MPTLPIFKGPFTLVIHNDALRSARRYKPQGRSEDVIDTANREAERSRSFARFIVEDRDGKTVYEVRGKH